MSLKSTSTRYGSVALSLHWVSAALILLLIPMGFAMPSASEDLRMGLYRAHAFIGILVGILTLARLVWWGGFDRRPDATNDDPAFQRLIATAVHRAFYPVLLLLVASGIGMLVVSGLGAVLVSGDWGLMVMKLSQVPPRFAHGALARLLMGLLALHILGALYHHWIKRDGLLLKMSPVKDQF